MHIQWYLVGRVSLVDQVVGVQGQGEQRHGKDLKFNRRSFMTISSDKVGYSIQFVSSLDLIHVT